MRKKRRHQCWRSKSRLVLLVIMLLFVTIAAFGQEQPEEVAISKLRQGIDLFYMAKFESAVRFLREVLLEGTLSKSERFDAYVYIGFSLIRQNEAPELVDKSFIEALNADPQKSLNRFKIPPDLLARFELVKANTMGGIVLQSDPPDAAALLVNTDYDVELFEITPVVFDNLLVGEYDLLVAKNTFKQQVTSVVIRPGVVDTLLITLVKKPKPIYKRWWTWGGGLAIATALAIATSGGGEGEPPESSDLPPPPKRP